MTPTPIELVETDASADPALLVPFDEQTAFDVAAGERTLFALRRTQAGSPVGSAVLGEGALDLFIRPEFRAQGLGAAATGRLLALAGDGDLAAWSHEDHPAARALAARFGFAPVRTLLQQRAALGDGAPAGSRAPHAAPARANIGTFRVGRDDAEWLALNAQVFAWHPEQGRLTAADLAQRVAEPWFLAEDFLVARDPGGAMVGYCWLKVEGAVGEIYVIGVAPEAAGHGLGRELMETGLAHLAERGCEAAELYVEADNERAVGLYRSLGFTDHARHVQYVRVPPRVRG